MEYTLGYSLRPGRPADARSVRKIFLAALAEHGFARSEANVNAEIPTFGLGDPKRVDLVVAYGGRVVGFAIVLPMAARTGELAKLFVAPSHRVRGVATMLLNAAINSARARGYGTLFLETRIEFERALCFYESRGWVPDPVTAGSPLRTYQLELVDAWSRSLAAAPVAAHSSFWTAVLPTLLDFLRRATQVEERLSRKIKTL